MTCAAPTRLTHVTHYKQYKVLKMRLCWLPCEAPCELYAVFAEIRRVPGTSIPEKDCGGLQSKSQDIYGHNGP